MADNTDIFTESTAFAGGTIALMARVVKSDNTNLVQAATVSVRVDVYDLSSPDAITPVNSSGVAITDGSAFSTPAVTDVIHDALVTDSRWTRDSIGANFICMIVLPTRDKTFEVRITIAASNGDTIVFAYHIDAK
jgi:hypothetical protein